MQKLNFTIRAKVILYLIANLLLMSGCHHNKPMMLEQTISDNWTFAEADEMKFYQASVPGTVHTDLLKNSLIPDPFAGCNEAQLQWIGEKDWIYKSTFDVKHDIFTSSEIRLRFEGLDTYANVKLNGETLLEANNMFREWEVDCKKILKEKGNILEIKFKSALNTYKTDSALATVFVPGGKWVYARKAPYHFGWDWGPTFITAGIWKPVSLIAWNKTKTSNLFIQTTHLSPLRAALKLSVDVESKMEQQAGIVVREINTGKIVFHSGFDLQQGDRTYNFDFEVPEPRLWWSNGLGEPYLYSWETELTTASGETFSKTINYGIRSLKLISQPDSIGTSFYFELNGRPVFAKGANYIPQHSFVTEVDDSSYSALIAHAKTSNMNMLRVWGGGIYEKDLFYELCDKNGIMVWQDFMFACAMIPGDEEFLSNVEEEAVDQLNRLRNHPSLALWCGNNESDEGWNNWGWQKQFNLSSLEQEKLWSTYSKVFGQLLPNLVERYAPHTPYVSSSPRHGWGRKESMTDGDAHYWGVWWGKQPFEKYLEKVPRFMSEFGFQALPALSTINTFQASLADSMITTELKCHQKHPVGFETIEVYLERENLFPESMKDLVFTSQIIQLQGIGMGIEAQRSAFPSCMGSLYWQLNDVWPVTSWSGIDSKGVWKGLQYRVQELYKPLMLSALPAGDSLRLTLLNEGRDTANGILSGKRISFSGEIQQIFRKEISVLPNHTWQQQFFTDDLLTRREAETSVLFFDFESFQNETVEEYHFTARLGKLRLPKQSLQTEITKVNGGFEIKIQSISFVAFMQLYIGENEAYFSDNFFHLKPGETKTIFCKTKLENINDFRNQLKTNSLNSFLYENPINFLK